MRPLYGVEPPAAVIIPPLIAPIERAPKPPEMRPLYGVEPPAAVIIPIEQKLPELGSVMGKKEIIEKQVNDRKELDSKGIKTVPEMNNGQKPFQEGSGKK